MVGRSRWRMVATYVAVIFWSFIVLFPFFWLITTSFKTPLAVTRGPLYLPWIDFDPTLVHWDYLINEQGAGILRHFRNSVIAAVGSTFFAVILGAMAGYGLSRFEYHWKAVGWKNDGIAFWIISNRFLPPAVFVVPFLILYARFGLIDTHIGLILVYTMFNVPFAVWIMRDFFDGLPEDLEDSARVDGASRLQAFFRIVLPLSTPGLVAISIFSFIFSWNEFLYALMLTNFDAITLPVLIAGQNTNRGVEWWFISGLTLIAVLPVVIIGLLLERFITSGLMSGAVKG